MKPFIVEERTNFKNSARVGRVFYTLNVEIYTKIIFNEQQMNIITIYKTTFLAKKISEGSGKNIFATLPQKSKFHSSRIAYAV
jgi:hypothetical protein